MVVQELVQGAPEFSPVEAGEVQEAGQFSKGYVAWEISRLRVKFESVRHSSDQVHVLFVRQVSLGNVGIESCAV